MKLILLPKDGGKTMAAVRWIGEARTPHEIRILLVHTEKARKSAMRAADHVHQNGHPLGWTYAVTTPDRWPFVQDHVRRLTADRHPQPTIVLGVDDVDRVLAAALSLPPNFKVGMITADKEE